MAAAGGGHQLRPGGDDDVPALVAASLLRNLSLELNELWHEGSYSGGARTSPAARAWGQAEAPAAAAEAAEARLSTAASLEKMGAFTSAELPCLGQGRGKQPNAASPPAARTWTLRHGATTASITFPDGVRTLDDRQSTYQLQRRLAAQLGLRLSADAGNGGGSASGDVACTGVYADPHGPVIPFYLLPSLDPDAGPYDAVAGPCPPQIAVPPIAAEARPTARGVDGTPGGSGLPLPVVPTPDVRAVRWEALAALQAALEGQDLPPESAGTQAQAQDPVLEGLEAARELLRQMKSHGFGLVSLPTVLPPHAAQAAAAMLAASTPTDAPSAHFASSPPPSALSQVSPPAAPTPPRPSLPDSAPELLQRMWASAAALFDLPEPCKLATRVVEGGNHSGYLLQGVRQWFQLRKLEGGVPFPDFRRSSRAAVAAVGSAEAEGGGQAVDREADEADAEAPEAEAAARMAAAEFQAVSVAMFELCREAALLALAGLAQALTEPRQERPGPRGARGQAQAEPQQRQRPSSSSPGGQLYRWMVSLLDDPSDLPWSKLSLQSPSAATASTSWAPPLQEELGPGPGPRPGPSRPGQAPPRRMSTDVLRLLQYIHPPGSPPSGLQGSTGLHTDKGFLTVAPAASLPGLMLLAPDAAAFVDVEARLSPAPGGPEGFGSGGFAVFPGEALGAASQGRVRATPHFVEERYEGRRRTSTPFFLAPRQEAVMAPPPPGLLAPQQERGTTVGAEGGKGGGQRDGDGRPLTQGRLVAGVLYARRPWGGRMKAQYAGNGPDGARESS
ncbi:hypothetical protein HYH03_003265 [Edaphochlamys debaryana]|uniref:Fe2OG dioxygenase domain-containing protein n=1 Tax=Edaphochlamys debaryana TaxID=47281 RepID=A0A835YA20_9CHLO|nr:hypothetical protein HYH03_003265 [Edaphochlamys debaryana]|eukprot:KAG2499082.1 hypothetical protein HYH03_003265 [Edaphochlamys debaryana]